MSQHLDERIGNFEQGYSASRAQFITRTYMHLFGAIMLFTAIEITLFTTGIAETMAQAMLNVNWLMILGGFVLVNWFASRTAYKAESKGAQYGALGLFVLAEAIIFVPLLYIADIKAPGAIQSASLITIVGFTGLTAIAFFTRKDFSFLGGLIKWGFMVALLAIVGGVIFGFQLGTFFSVAMIGLAGAAVLYDTSKILRDFPEDKYVSASLQLFASIALMLWYVLQLVMSRD